MILDRWTTVRASVACVLGFGAFASAAAQERTLFTWTSTVDREVIIVVRGRDVQVRASGLDASFRPRVDVHDAVPRSDGNVLVRLTNGRGNLQVLEQPSVRNGYTTTMRITDPRGGRDNYRFVAYWQPTRDGRHDDRWDDRDRRRDDDRCRHDNRNDRRGRDDDRCDDRRRDNDRWNDRDRNSSGIIRWSGDVDDVSEIHISGRRIDYVTRSGERIRNARLDMRGDGLPRRDLNLILGVSNGRGHVQVIQQPHRRNDYTAIVRITDRRSGYGVYDFSLAW